LALRLTPYGRRELVLATILLAALAGGGAYLARTHWAWLAVTAVAAAVWVWVISFFRDPDRDTPTGEGLFISPADGCVADITPLGPDSPLGRAGVQVGVFMSVFDVHVNRAPCDGVVTAVAHEAGAFLDARDPAASQRNESATITLSHPHGDRYYPIVFRQIAGLVARRIVTDLRPAQNVRRGQRMGMIKFGSRVELLVPEELAGQVRVQVGQRVRAGQTILVATESSNNE